MERSHVIRSWNLGWERGREERLQKRHTEADKGAIQGWRWGRGGTTASGAPQQVGVALLWHAVTNTNDPAVGHRAQPSAVNAFLRCSFRKRTVWDGLARQERAWLLLSICSLQELSAQDSRDHEPRNTVMLQGLRREPRARTAALLQSSGEGHV